MIDYNCEDGILTRIIEGHSANLSDIANLPPANEEFDETDDIKDVKDTEEHDIANTPLYHSSFFC